MASGKLIAAEHPLIAIPVAIGVGSPVRVLVPVFAPVAAVFMTVTRIRLIRLPVLHVFAGHVHAIFVAKVTGNLPGRTPAAIIAAEAIIAVPVAPSPA
jgi:hypothetical protein